MNMNSTDDYFWVWNPFDEKRKIFFMSDYPHLLKTTRNNLENSHGNLNSRNLHVSKFLYLEMNCLCGGAQKSLYSTPHFVFPVILPLQCIAEELFHINKISTLLVNQHTYICIRLDATGFIK